TNLTQDHLDFHQSLEDYFQAKAKLFAGLGKASVKAGKAAVINVDDPFGVRKGILSSAPVYSYGVEQPAQIRACDIHITSNGVRYRLQTSFGDVPLDLGLTGRFNVYNTLAA